ncbi:MAG: hypothetical protein BZ136_03780 [Methanosphaera sp. rholeuAM74]|nr:MAG: hypothetical protein BZ136_03780 [Methanosphaera sp. rholeuAM74]
MDGEVKEKIETLIKTNKENQKITKEIEEKLTKMINKIIQQPKKVDRILKAPSTDILIDPTDSIRIFIYNSYSEEELLSRDKLLEIINYTGVPEEKVRIGVQPNKLLIKILFHD